jgi:hypothetical protein
MKTTRKALNIFPVVILSIGLGFASFAAYAVDTSPYLVNLNSREATNLGNLGGPPGEALGINDLGQENRRVSLSLPGPNGVGRTRIAPDKFGAVHPFAINDSGQVAGLLNLNGPDYF